MYITDIDKLWNDEESCKNKLYDIIKSIKYIIESEFIKEKSKKITRKFFKNIKMDFYMKITIKKF